MIWTGSARKFGELWQRNGGLHKLGKYVALLTFPRIVLPHSVASVNLLSCCTRVAVICTGGMPKKNYFVSDREQDMYSRYYVELISLKILTSLLIASIDRPGSYEH
jgi:hypothetical protein